MFLLWTVSFPYMYARNTKSVLQWNHVEDLDLHRMREGEGVDKEE